MSETNNWIVYVHINKLNGKRYVGITSKHKPEYRWNNGRGYRENPHFYSAIEAYGWDCFEHIVLFKNFSAHMAKEMEQYLISIWRTQDSAYGYNMTAGGDGTPGFHPSEETRRKQSNARRRENLSPETRRRKSEAMKRRRLSDEHKRKIGLGNSHPVDMMTLGGEVICRFESAMDAERKTGVFHSGISLCCNHKLKTSGGYVWRFA